MNREWFRNLREAWTLIETCRQFYNNERPNRATGRGLGSPLDRLLLRRN
jgi:hypothetical protein